MRVLSIIHIKGGVGKTVSSVSIAYILATEYGKRVLLIDNDKQGDASKMVNLYSSKSLGTAELMTERDIDMSELIQHTDYENLDIITSNMSLQDAIREVEFDRYSPQQDRFCHGLEKVADQYDYCIIDNAPDINMSTINALVASDDIMIPIMIDEFAIEGLEELTKRIDKIRKGFNPKLRLCGCFITNYNRNDPTASSGSKFVRAKGYELFNTHIRNTPKMSTSTFVRKPINECSKRSGASKDYMALVDEYLSMCKWHEE